MSHSFHWTLIIILWLIPLIKKHNGYTLRSDIKSSGKFAIFRRLKIEGGGVNLVNYGKIESKDRNY